MTLEQYLFIALIQTILSAAVGTLSLIRFRSRSLLVKLIGFIFLAGFSANTTSYLLTRTVTYREFINMPGIVYAVVTMALFSYIYWIILFKRKLISFLATSVLFTVFAFLNFYYIQKSALNSHLYLAYVGVLMCYSLWYFYVLIRDLPALHVHRMPMFWFNSAFLILGAGTFFLYAFTSYLVNVLRNDMITYWSFHNMVSIFAHIIILIGLSYDLRQSKPIKPNVVAP